MSDRTSDATAAARRGTKRNAKAMREPTVDAALADIVPPPPPAPLPVATERTSDDIDVDEAMRAWDAPGSGPSPPPPEESAARPAAAAASFFAEAIKKNTQPGYVFTIPSVEEIDDNAPEDGDTTWYIEPQHLLEQYALAERTEAVRALLRQPALMLDALAERHNNNNKIMTATQVLRALNTQHANGSGIVRELDEWERHLGQHCSAPPRRCEHALSLGDDQHPSMAYLPLVAPVDGDVCLYALLRAEPPGQEQLYACCGGWLAYTTAHEAREFEG